jgi:membrane-bound serine protease (ClpP class)
LILGALAATASLARPASASASAAAPERTTAQAASGSVRIDVIEVSGLLDPILVDFIGDAIRKSEADGSAVVVIRLDSRGRVAPKADLARLIRQIRGASVPVATWVGPGREARAEGEAFRLFEAAAIQGMAPGSRAGGLTAEQAAERGVVDVLAPTLGDFIVGLDGKTTEQGVIDVPTTPVEREGRPTQRQLAPNASVRFHEPSLLTQLLHAVATPSPTYLLLVLGLLLIVFEFFTAGVGVAGAVGAASLVLASYGLGVLPTRPLALVVLVVGILGYTIDVQAGAPRAWTAIGTVATLAGSFFLFGGGLSVPLVVLALVDAGLALFMVAGMPAMIRTRFSTPTIGRESMLGEQGTALSDVDPDGVVSVRDAPWRARTNRATPIRAGEPVRVASIDGLLLEVEPLEGAARDAGH